MKTKQANIISKTKTTQKIKKHHWVITGVLEDLIWRRMSLRLWSLEALFKFPWRFSGRSKPVPSNPFFALSSFPFVVAADPPSIFLSFCLRYTQWVGENWEGLGFGTRSEVANQWLLVCTAMSLPFSCPPLSSCSKLREGLSHPLLWCTLVV